MVITWLKDAINWLATQFPEGTFLHDTFNIRGFIAVILVSLICGAIGSLVVANRMAFFSDGLTHCTFAGVGLGLLLGFMLGAQKEGPFYTWALPALMIAFGTLVGLAIALVRDATSLATDTVIGVFFAGALGFGAIILKALSQVSFFDPANFMFGSMVTVQEEDLLILFVLALVTGGFLFANFNRLVFASFNANLARSRRIPVRWCNYLFIVILALVVNLCVKIVGALLLSALLVVPAATAANVCRNLRQLFWMTVVLCMTVGVLGQWLSWEAGVALKNTSIGGGGSIVVLSVLLFFLSLPASALLARWERRSNPVQTAAERT